MLYFGMVPIHIPSQLLWAYGTYTRLNLWDVVAGSTSCLIRKEKLHKKTSQNGKQYASPYWLYTIDSAILGVYMVPSGLNTIDVGADPERDLDADCRHCQGTVYPCCKSRWNLPKFDLQTQSCYVLKQQICYQHSHAEAYGSYRCWIFPCS